MNHKLSKFEKEVGITTVILTVMTLKIALGIYLFHRWKVQAAKEGRVFNLTDN